MKINLCEDRNWYYKQTNNELAPSISCQCTSMVAGLDIVYNHDVSVIEKITPYRQPEDDLRRFVETDKDTQDFYKRSHPGSKIHPAEWADVLVFAVNKIYGKKVVYFDGDITQKKIIADLTKGFPVMVSCQYPAVGVPGHYILVVGVDEDRLIVNDPYKNFLTGDPDGFNCIYTPDLWRHHSKGYGMRYTGA